MANRILRFPCVLLAAAAALVLPSCLSTAKAIPAPSATLALGGNAEASFSAIVDGKNTIEYGGKTYKPTTSPGSTESSVICDVDMKISNNGDAEIEEPDSKKIEMALLDASGNLEFQQWTKPYDASSNASMDEIMAMINGNGEPAQKSMMAAGGFSREKVFFVHKAASVPVAFAANRAEWVMLIPESDPRYGKAVDALKKAKNVEIATTMAILLPWETVSVFMKGNGVSVNDLNGQGLNVLYVGIMAFNDSVVDGAIKEGADIHAPARHNLYGPIEPIHAAVMKSNAKAIKALVAAGVDVKAKAKGGEEPGVIAVRAKDIEALKILRECGLDVKALVIPQAWSGAMPIADYAVKKDFPELKAYLDSLP